MMVVGCARKARTASPACNMLLSVLQIFTSPSSEPEKSSGSCTWQNKERTQVMCPSRVASQLFESRFQTLMVLS